MYPVSSASEISRAYSTNRSRDVFMSTRKPVVLDARQAAADAEDHAAARDVVEQRDLLGDAQRVVPRQHDDAGAEQDVRVLAGHVRQPLHRVGAHRVVVEVVLDRPQRLEAELDGEVAQPQLVLVHLVVAERVVRVLEGGVVTDVHAFIPLVGCSVTVLVAAAAMACRTAAIVT